MQRSFILADDVIKGDFTTFDLQSHAVGSSNDIVLPVGVPLAEANREVHSSYLKAVQRSQESYR